MSTLIRCDRPTCKKVDEVGDKMTVWTDDWCVKKIDLCINCSLELKGMMKRWWEARPVKEG